MEITNSELRKIILNKQMITNLSDEPLAVCSRLNGFQTQADNTMLEQVFAVRTELAAFRQTQWRDELVRCWSIRGQLHVFPYMEIPLFLHRGRSIGLRDVDDIRTDIYLREEEKRVYADLILEKLSEKPLTLNELKEVTAKAGLHKEAERSVFNPWGGLIRYLIETGQVYQQYSSRKYKRLEKFEPWEQEKAELEIARRYFENYGPCTIEDARTYFKRRKRVIQDWMEKLELEEVVVDGISRFGINIDHNVETLPDLLLLSDSDPLLIGYEKEENPFVEAEHTREIFGYSGLIRPGILVGDRIVGTWRFIEGKPKMNIFAELTKAEIERIENFLHNLERK
ncbi:MAG TPA: winged helix DNA-binding domain-containing protein [Clostridiaceae bacterium]|nr:winged helix DNA-binding domain-containing protein [Clostridiaceae bacterium]